MKKTHQDRQAFIDRLEKKYIKKVQLQAFRRESEQLKNRLTAMRGANIRQVGAEQDELLIAPHYKLTFSL